MNTQKSINLETLNSDNLFIKPPFKTKISKGSLPISFSVSDGYYSDDNVTQFKLYLILPPRDLFGFNESHPLGQESRPDNLNGYTIGWQLYSSVTMPTEEDLLCESAFDAFYNRIWQQCKELEAKHGKDSTKWDLSVPKSMKPSIMEDDPTDFLKPILEFPKIKDAKGVVTEEVDTTKSKRAYFKLETRGEGEKMSVETDVYQGFSDDKSLDIKVHPRDFIGSRMKAEIALRWDGIFWGTHGNKPYKASLRMKVAEIRFVLTQGSRYKIGGGRLLGPPIKTPILCEAINDITMLSQLSAPQEKKGEFENPEIDTTKQDEDVLGEKQELVIPEPKLAPRHAEQEKKTRKARKLNPPQ